jgi:hypothetical protein
MPTHAAGTFALNCAYHGIPCIGYEGLDTQELCFPHLTVEMGNLNKAKQLAEKLKIDEDIKSDELSSNNIDSNNVNDVSNTLTNEALAQPEAHEAADINTDLHSKYEEHTSENNGLENFELNDDDTPELFNSETNDELSSSSEEINSDEEEDLEIPAFLRRQKN